MTGRCIVACLSVATVWGCSGPQMVATPLVSGKMLGATLYDVDVSKRGTVFLRTSKGIHALGKAGWIAGTKDVIEACVSGNRLLTVAGGKLSVHEDSGMRSLLEVPLQGLKLSANEKHVYLVGSTTGRVGVYVFDWEQGHQQVLELPEPQSALAVDGDRVLFALGPAIFSFELGGELHAQTVLAGFDRIESLAPWPGHDALLLSDGEALYAMLPVRGQFVLIFADAGGTIAIDRDRVYLLSKRRNTLYRLDGLAKALRDPKLVRPLPGAKLP